MKWISILSIVVSGLFLNNRSDAGLFKLPGSKANSSCTEECQLPGCCPTIARPCLANIYRYQRKFRNPPPAACLPGLSCITGCTDESLGCAPTMCPPASQTDSCDGLPNVSLGCGEGCTGHSPCCDRQKCCEIAALIYESMTACYATERRNAIHRLGDRYDCVCHPEIMNAFIYALNDSDERVRSKAADEIGDQVRVNRCILGPPTIRALQQALADRDRGVRRQAEEALQQCGFRIVDGRCQPNDCSDAAVWSTAAHSAEIPGEDAPVDSQDISTPEFRLNQDSAEDPESAAVLPETAAAGIEDEAQPPSLFSLTGQSSVVGLSLPAVDSSPKVNPPPVPPVSDDALTSDEFFPSRLPHGPEETRPGKLSRIFKWKN